MRVILNTGRNIPQGVAVEHKASPAYQAAVSVCHMNPVDLMELGIDKGGHVTLTSQAGSIVLVTRAAEEMNRGEVFVPLGPYSNHIIPAETHATGMPDFKDEMVEVVPTDEPVRTIWELMESIGGVRYDP